MENILPDNSIFLTAMHTVFNGGYKPPGSSFKPTCNQHGYNSYDSGGYKSFNRNRGTG